MPDTWIKWRDECLNNSKLHAPDAKAKETALSMAKKERNGTGATGDMPWTG